MVSDWGNYFGCGSMRIEFGVGGNCGEGICGGGVLNRGGWCGVSVYRYRGGGEDVYLNQICQEWEQDLYPKISVCS